MELMVHGSVCDGVPGVLCDNQRKVILAFVGSEDVVVLDELSRALGRVV